MKRAAFFDLDLTITDRDSFRLFLKHYYLRSRLHYLPYILTFAILRKLRFISLQEFKERALIGLRGKTEEEINTIGVTFFKNYLRETIRQSARRRIKEHQMNGELIFIVSASPNIYLEAIARHLKCDGYICSDLHYRKHRFSGTLSGVDCIGAEKKQRIEKLADTLKINLNKSSVYSDHEADLQFLEAAGKPFVVSPTVKLHQIALTRNWSIEYW